MCTEPRRLEATSPGAADWLRSGVVGEKGRGQVWAPVLGDVGRGRGWPPSGSPGSLSGGLGLSPGAVTSCV